MAHIFLMNVPIKVRAQLQPTFQQRKMQLVVLRFQLFYNKYQKVVIVGIGIAAVLLFAIVALSVTALHSSKSEYNKGLNLNSRIQGVTSKLDFFNQAGTSYWFCLVLQITLTY